MEPPHFFSFRWEYPDGDEPTETNAPLVEFSLEARGDSTRLRLVESGLDGIARSDEAKETYFTEHTRGWATIVERLRDYAPTQRARRRLMPTGVVEAEALVAAVTEPTRRQMLDLLLERGESTATVLADSLPISRQAVSKHLAVFSRVGLVEGEKSGREMRYRLNVERLDEATRSLGELAAAWDRRLAAHQADRRGRSRQKAGERGLRPLPFAGYVRWRE